MTRKLDKAIEIADREVRPTFERVWKEVIGDMPINYRILIWGSVVEDRREPNDVDIIFEYETHDSISPSEEKSMEGWIRSVVYIDDFSYVDPLIVTYTELPSIISKSRVGRIYSVDEDGWVSFD